MPVNTSAIQIEFNQQPPKLTRNSSKCTFEFRAEILSFSRKSLFYCRLPLFSVCLVVYNSISCPYIYKASYLDLYLKPGTGSSEYFFRVQEGGEIGQFYGYEYAGVDENGNMLILNDKDEQIPISQADAKYKRYIGNGAPKHFLSWSNNLTWRNFDLSVFFRGTFGFDVFNMRKYGMGLQGCGTDNVLRSAYLEDKNIRTGGGVISSYFLEDGSFIKLENVTLGYNFTPKNRKLLDNMRIYLSAKNLFTLTGYSGNDPSIIDVNGIQPGVDSNSAYPTATQLSLGVTLRFK